MRKGFTLVECMVASAIICILSLALFEGVGRATEWAYANGEVLAAEAIAWDAVWKRFNENYDKLAYSTTESLPASASGELYYPQSPATLTVWAASVPGFPRLKAISADVEWGPANRRRKRSDYRETFVYRSDLERVPWN